MLRALAVLLATYAVGDSRSEESVADGRSTPCSSAVLLGDDGGGHDDRTADWAGRLRAIFLESAELGYSERLLLTESLAESEIQRAAKDPLQWLVRLGEGRNEPIRSLVVVLVGDCRWRNGEPRIEWRGRGDGGVRSLPLATLVERVDALEIRCKLVVLIAGPDSDFGREDFALLTRFCRLWNSRTYPSHWMGFRCKHDRNALTSKLVDAVGPGADVRFGSDGLVSAREFAEALLNAAEKSDQIASKFLWHSNRAGTFEHADTTPDSPIAIAKAARDRVELLAQKLARLGSEGTLSAAEVAEGGRLLRRMPMVEADRELRVRYIDLIEERIPLAEFQSARRRLLTQRALPFAVARRFSDVAWECLRMARSRYVRKEEVGAAYRLAVDQFYWICGESPSEAVASELASLAAVDSPAVRETLLKVRMQLGKREDLDRDRDLELFLRSFAEQLDNYCAFYPPPQYAEEKKLNEGRFTGVGLKVQESQQGGLEIIAVLPGGPAQKAELRTGDRIVRIRNQSLIGMDFDEAANLLAGRANERVALWVKRPSFVGELQFELAFGNVQVETVLGWRRDGDSRWDHWIDAQGRIGYVRICMFSEDTVSQLRGVLSRFRQNPTSGLILDLRDNPGGVLNAAIETAGMFVGRRPVVLMKSFDGGTQTRVGQAFGAFRDVPMAVLINRNSASGAELLAAALADNGRAVLVGERSFGKGSIQSVFELEGGASALKLTTELFLRPAGGNLNRFRTSRDDDDWGVKPDPRHTVELSAREMEQSAQVFAEELNSSNADQRLWARPKDRVVIAALESLLRKNARPPH